MLAGVDVLGGDRDPPVVPVHVVGGRARRRGRGRRRSRPRRCRPRRGRRRRASCGCRSAAGGRRRRCPAWSRRSGWWRAARRRARRGRPGRGRGRSCRRPARRGRRPAAPRRRACATTCGNASRKKPEIRTVTSMRGRPSSASGIGSRLVDPARRLVPDRPDAEQREHLGDVVAGGAHRGGAPHRQPDRLRPVAVVVAVAGQQRVGHRLAGLPGQPGRHRLRVDGVEVAAGRQHVDQAAQRRADGPAGMKPPSRACSTWSISSVVPASRGTTSVAANLSIRGDVGGCPVSASTASASQPGVLQRRRPARGRVASTASTAARSSSPSSARPSACAQAGHGLVAAPHLAGAQDRQHQVDPGARPSGAAPRTCRPSRIWASLISHSQPSTCSRKSSNASSSGRSSRPEVVVHLRGLHQRPDLLADGRQLGRVHRGDVGVLVEQLLEPRDVAVGLGAGHRRDQVVDERGVRAALGLGALARVVDQERVDQRQVAERGVGAAGRRHAERLAGQPLQVAVLAEVHDGVGAEAALSRASGRRPGSGGWAAGRGRGRSRPGSRRTRAAAGPAARRCRPAARRARSRRRGPWLRSTNSSPGGGPQCSIDAVARGRRAAWRTRRVVARPEIRIGLPASCSVGQPLLVLAAGAISAWISASPSPASSAGNRRRSTVAGVRACASQQRDRAGRGVQADGVADAGVLGRVRREHQRDPLVGGRDVPQPGVAHGDAGDPGAALGVGDVGGQAVGVDLLERERHGDDPAVELRDRDLGGDVQRRQPVVVGLPRSRRLVRHSPCRIGMSSAASCADVPGLVVAAGRAPSAGVVPPPRAR